MADEIGEQLAAVRRVDDLGVEHQAEEAALLVGRDRIRRAFGRGDDAEPLGQRLDPVAMAHPDLVASRPGFQRPSNSTHSPVISMKARPNSRLSDGATRPPSWCAMVCWP